MIIAEFVDTKHKTVHEIIWNPFLFPRDDISYADHLISFIKTLESTFVELDAKHDVCYVKLSTNRKEEQGNILVSTFLNRGIMLNCSTDWKSGVLVMMYLSEFVYAMINQEKR